MHLSISRTRLDNLCLVSLMSLSYKLIVRAVFKSVYWASNSFLLCSSRLIYSSFCIRRFFKSAFSCFNLSYKNIKCLNFPSKELTSFLSSSVILHQILHKYIRLDLILKIFKEEFAKKKQKKRCPLFQGFVGKNVPSDADG